MKHVILVQIQSYTTVAAQPRRCSRPRNPTTDDSCLSRPTISGSENYVVAAQYREKVLGLFEISGSFVEFSPDAVRAQGRSGGIHMHSSRLYRLFFHLINPCVIIYPIRYSKRLRRIIFPRIKTQQRKQLCPNARRCIYPCSEHEPCVPLHSYHNLSPLFSQCEFERNLAKLKEAIKEMQ